MKEENNNTNINRDDKNDNLYVDRSQIVKNFTVNFDNEAQLPEPEPNSDRPQHKGEVYFANYAKSNSRSVRPASTPAKNTAQQNGKMKKTKPALSKKAKRTKRRYSVWSMATLAFIIIVTVTLSYISISTVNDILSISKSDEPVEVYLSENATTNEVIDILHDAGLINRPGMCKLFYKAYSKLRNMDTPEYSSGYFDLQASMGLEGMLRELKVDTGKETITILFQEGWSTTKMFSKLESNGICEAEYLYAALEKANFNFDFIKSLKYNASENRYLLLEGYLFPDTYEFYADTNASAIIELLLKNFDSKWTDEYTQKAKELGYSMDEIITIASIIQRESGSKGEMAEIASVIYNRLNNRLSFPTLDCDSTADFVKNDITQRLGEEKATAYLPYYDTYQCTGLPAGPVCNPGIDAIEAALNPETTDYYYFLHDKSGNIHLSKTFSEHQRNINEYLN